MSRNVKTLIEGILGAIIGFFIIHYITVQVKKAKEEEPYGIPLRINLKGYYSAIF